MFCEKCGNKITDSNKFCTKCGWPSGVRSQLSLAPGANLDQKWWLRLLKVGYIFLYLQILWIMPVVWSVNSTSYIYNVGYKDTPGSAFWYSVLAAAIFVVVLRMIKITMLYIVFAQKPDWKKEFKKFY